MRYLAHHHSMYVFYPSVCFFRNICLLALSKNDPSIFFSIYLSVVERWDEAFSFFIFYRLWKPLSFLFQLSSTMYCGISKIKMSIENGQKMLNGHQKFLFAHLIQTFCFQWISRIILHYCLAWNVLLMLQPQLYFLIS